MKKYRAHTLRLMVFCCAVFHFAGQAKAEDEGSILLHAPVSQSPDSSPGKAPGRPLDLGNAVPENPLGSSAALPQSSPVKTAETNHYAQDMRDFDEARKTGSVPTLAEMTTTELMKCSLASHPNEQWYAHGSFYIPEIMPKAVREKHKGAQNFVNVTITTLRVGKDESHSAFRTIFDPTIRETNIGGAVAAHSNFVQNGSGNFSGITVPWAIDVLKYEPGQNPFLVREPNPGIDAYFTSGQAAAVGYSNAYEVVKAKNGAILIHKKRTPFLTKEKTVLDHLIQDAVCRMLSPEEKAASLAASVPHSPLGPPQPAEPISYSGPAAQPGPPQPAAPIPASVPVPVPVPQRTQGDWKPVPYSGIPLPLQ